MRFTKMHGIGNDYVYVDCFEEQVADPAALAVAVSDRHFGVGADGLILVLPGTARPTCGCGCSTPTAARPRCAATASAAWPSTPTTTACSRVQPHADRDRRGRQDGRNCNSAPTARSPQPRWTWASPIAGAAGDPGQLRRPNAWSTCRWRPSGRTYRVTCVSMGNPHAVIFVADVAAVDLLGRRRPPSSTTRPSRNRINVHFVQVRSAGEVTRGTWERGSGITLACGTGASAVCVAGVLTGRAGRQIIAHLPGGDLDLEWRQADNHVYMTGPAVEVFSGDWPA